MVAVAFLIFTWRLWVVWVIGLALFTLVHWICSRLPAGSGERAVWTWKGGDRKSFLD